MYHPESDSLFEVSEIPSGAEYDPDYGLCADVTGDPHHEQRFLNSRKKAAP
jgi:hypothetical protein